MCNVIGTAQRRTSLNGSLDIQYADPGPYLRQTGRGTNDGSFITFEECMLDGFAKNNFEKVLRTFMVLTPSRIETDSKI